MFQLQLRFIGVEVTKNALKLAAMRQNRKRWEVSVLKEISNADTLSTFYNQLKDGFLISALSSRDLLMRPCEIPLKKPKDIAAALDFHVEPLLPYTLDKAIIQSQITDQNENTSFLSIYAVRQDHLFNHLELLKNHHLEPETVTSKPHALAAFSQFLPQTGTPILLVHESEEEISFVLVEKGQILIFRSIEHKKDISAEIQKTFLSFASSHKAKLFDSIYFLGKSPELKSLLQQLSGKAVLLPSSPDLSLTQEELIHFGLAIGTAVASQSVNFRQKEFTYPHRFKRLKKPVIAYLILSTLLTCAICFFGETFLFQKKKTVAEAYASLLKSERIAQPESNFKTPQEYLSQLNIIEKQVKGRPETFSLLPQVPKVKEVLSWLASISRPQGGEIPPITIESFHYQMIKRPDFSHKKEKYKVRVDLEFSAKDALSARSFQDALKNSHSLVDTREEIQWLPVKGKFKVSFFLKDKTKYS